MHNVYTNRCLATKHGKKRESLFLVINSPHLLARGAGQSPQPKNKKCVYNVDTMGEEIRLRAAVGKWGNSAAVRIPASLMTQANLKDKSSIDLVLRDGNIVLEPVTNPELSLEGLLSQITPNNLHESMDFGQPVGKEAF